MFFSATLGCTRVALPCIRLLFVNWCSVTLLPFLKWLSTLLKRSGEPVLTMNPVASVYGTVRVILVPSFLSFIVRSLGGRSVLS